MCVLYHPLCRFLLCVRLNTMAQCVIMPDTSIIVSKFQKWEGKFPHSTLLFREHPLLNSLCFWRSILFKLFSIKLIHSFRKFSISIIVTSDTSSSLLFSSSIGKASTMSSFLEIPSNMASLLDIRTMRTLGIVKVSVLCVSAAVSERTLLTCSASIMSQKRLS